MGKSQRLGKTAVYHSSVFLHAAETYTKPEVWTNLKYEQTQSTEQTRKNPKC